MTVILRLQGLDVNASTKDVRAFFEYLHIPDGGVYIVGGHLGEAFIAFTSERDGQLALRRTGNFLKGSVVTLHVSSVEELEQKLKSLLKRKKSSPAQITVKRAHISPDPDQLQPHTSDSANLPPTLVQKLDPIPADPPQPLHPDTSDLKTLDENSIDSKTAFLLGICTVLQGLQSTHQRENSKAVAEVDFPNAKSTVVYDERTLEDSQNSKPGYVRLFGLPASTTKEDICHFFKGLNVLEAIVNVKLGVGYGCLVKFASAQEACDALLHNQQSLGSICVEVRRATEKMWTGALDECENGSESGGGVKSKQSPLKETANHIQNPTSVPRGRERFRSHLPSKSAKKPRIDGDPNTPLSPTTEYTVMVRNLPQTMTKTEIKELFGCPNIAHRNVLHLLDMDGNRTDTAFVMFTCFEDYEYAMNLSGCHVGSHSIDVSSISKMTMREIMAKNHPRNRKRVTNKELMGKSDPTETKEQDVTVDPAALRHVFVRNLPADVQKSQIKSLFHGFRLKKDSITLLCDSDGKSIGEAVVQFKSDKLASLAQSLHGTDFLETKVLLTRISARQMEDILARNV